MEFSLIDVNVSINIFVWKMLWKLEIVILWKVWQVTSTCVYILEVREMIVNFAKERNYLSIWLTLLGYKRNATQYFHQNTICPTIRASKTTFVCRPNDPNRFLYSIAVTEWGLSTPTSVLKSQNILRPQSRPEMWPSKVHGECWSGASNTWPSTSTWWTHDASKWRSGSVQRRSWLPYVPCAATLKTWSKVKSPR